jgi:uncharacterized membrane protein YbaN (DUF454 family)
MAEPFDPPPSPPRGRPHGLRRLFLLVTGCVALVLGLVGVILPLLPTTPFILLAAACFAGAWPAMHRRLAGSRLFGPMLQSEPGARHIPVATKIYAIAFTWLSIGATILFAVEALWLRCVLGAVALGVTGFLLWMPSRPRSAAR